MFNKVILVDVIPGTGKPAIQKKQNKVLIDHFNLMLDNKPVEKKDHSYTGIFIMDTLTNLY